MSASRHPVGRARLAQLPAALLMAVCAPAFAQIDCWADAEHTKTADLRAVSDPAAAPLQRILHALNALLRARPELHELPRTRLRSSWQIGGQWDAPARPAHFLLRIARCMAGTCW